MSWVRNNHTEKLVIESILVLSVVVVSFLHHFAVLKFQIVSYENKKLIPSNNIA